MSDLNILLSAAAVRERCDQLGQRALAGETSHFRYQAECLDRCVEVVSQECRDNYPDLDIPLHSRWRHFVIAGVDLWRYHADRVLHDMDNEERTRVAIDLVFLSVVLDAGAGSSWIYIEPVTGQRLTRSEGLAAATINLFFTELGPESGYRLTAAAIADLDADRLQRAFQHRPDNTLLGMEGRIELLTRLGARLEQLGEQGIDHPGALLDHLREAHGVKPEAGQVLALVLEWFNPMWPSGLVVDGVFLGDCGRHTQVTGPGNTGGLVPFHKLSQWLTWSLIEPLADAGMAVSKLDQLTGLPEYRNGGLLMDTGLLVPIDPDLTRRTLQVEHEAVVEWRGLTVWLLDQIVEQVRTEFGMDADSLPLGSVLQGGTWSAGRSLANRLRGGTPPLTLAIDGTVF